MAPSVANQGLLDEGLERAPDRAKAQFALLVGDAMNAAGDQLGSGEPFSVPFDAMTKREWNRDDARQLSLSFDAALERSAVEHVERHSHMCLLCETRSTSSRADRSSAASN